MKYNLFLFSFLIIIFFCDFLWMKVLEFAILINYNFYLKKKNILILKKLVIDTN